MEKNERKGEREEVGEGQSERVEKGVREEEGEGVSERSEEGRE